MMKNSRSRMFLLLSILWLTQTGCGLLIGNIKPVDEKSDQYGVTDLAKENPAVWTKLTPSEEGANTKEPETTATEVSDVAFQSKKSASIISLNSSCRATGESPEKSLKELTDQLLLGVSDAAQRIEKNLTTQDFPALETTVQGKMSGRELTLRTVVLRRKTCVYDLLYMAPPAHFAENEKDFNHFVASLRLK